MTQMNDLNERPASEGSSALAEACRLGVVIVNYRTQALTMRCIASFASVLEALDARLVIIDNDSQDGSYEHLLEYCGRHSEAERIKVISSARNGGFSYGNNIGIKVLHSDYILLLNSDAIVHPGALESLLKVAQVSPDAGLISPTIIASSGVRQVSRFRNHSPLSELIDGAQTGPVTKLLKFAETPIFPGDENAAPDWVSFAVVLISRQAIEKAGPMDEGFFLYFEDCDYSRRIRSLGFRVAFAPDAVFTHDAGGSTNLAGNERALARLPSYYYQSRARYFRKFYGPVGPLLANLAWLVGRGIAKIRGVVGRPAPPICDKQARDIWIGWRNNL